MEIIVEREEVWAASIEDRPGALAEKLTALAEAGADLDFAIARRSRDPRSAAVVFVTPIRGEQEVRVAKQLGFSVTDTMHTVRVDAPDQPGCAARLTQKLAAGGLNLRGFSLAVIHPGCVMHLAFDSEQDAAKAVTTLRQSI